MNIRPISIDEATGLVLARSSPLDPREVSLEDALGLVIDQDVSADLDSPPFDKATMDGYAVRASDLAEPGEHRLTVVDDLYAGSVPSKAVGTGQAARIMTGAPIPPGADAVINVERSRPVGDDAVRIDLDRPIRPGHFILGRGREMRQGDRLIDRGDRLGPARLAMVAAGGLARVRVIPLPTVAVVPTGDEVVDASTVPGPGQIRDTNGPLLLGLARSWGVASCNLVKAVPDRPDDLRAAFRAALDERDVLIASGGVSAGLKDLVPRVLVELGVEPVFHHVSVKPGKPIWFGVGPPRSGGRPGTRVFGLPGNPASGVVGFLLFIRPCLEALAGRSPSRNQVESARLSARYVHKGDRPTFHPCLVREDGVEPLPWAGSADLRGVAGADGFAAFPAGDAIHEPGSVVGFLGLGPSNPTGHGRSR